MLLVVLVKSQHYPSVITTTTLTYLNQAHYSSRIGLFSSSVIVVISEDPGAVVSGVQSTVPCALTLHPWSVTWYALGTDQSPSREFRGRSR